ncbi:uncharacterized protein LOC121390870, partial [Gigantopelta aegis]|uniref:uncharacterized protein LOC121390870 n=1 Tax=Gigantopelta aegis TaxID=1735272 RepID=UPI001B88D539
MPSRPGRERGAPHSEAGPREGLKQRSELDPDTPPPSGPRAQTAPTERPRPRPKPDERTRRARKPAETPDTPRNKPGGEEPRAERDDRDQGNRQARPQPVAIPNVRLQPGMGPALRANPWSRKLRIQFADFPYLHFAIGLEGLNLGDPGADLLGTAWTRITSLRRFSRAGPESANRTTARPGAFTGTPFPYLGKPPIPGDWVPLQRKENSSPGGPRRPVPNSFCVTERDPCGPISVS